MTIRRVSGSAVPPPSTTSTSSASKPATSSSSSAATSASTSSFQSAATSSSGSSFSSSHIDDSNNDDVNDFVNQALDAFSSSDPLSGVDSNSPGGYLRDMLGLKFYGKSAGQQVLTKIKQYVKDNPDASVDDVKNKMSGEAMTTGMVMKFMESKMDEMTHKNPWKDDD